MFLVFKRLNLVDYGVLLITLIACSGYIVNPEDYYSSLGEELYLQKHPLSIFFILLSGAMFILGSISGYKKMPETKYNSKYLTIIMLLSGFAIISLILYFSTILYKFPISYLSNQSNENRYEIWKFVSGAKIGFIVSFATAALSSLVFTILVKNFRNKLSILFLLVITIGIFASSIMTNTKAGIFYLMAIFFLPITILYKQRRIPKSIARPIIFFTPIVLVSFFMINTIGRISSVNGSNSLDQIRIATYALYGYLFSGLNKYAAIFAGIYQPPELNMANILLPLLNIPILGGLYTSALSDFGVSVNVINADDWKSSFETLSTSIFNQGFNVNSIYGELFGSFGYLGLIPMFIFGYISKRMWNRYIAGDLVGVCVLPYIFFSIIQWLVYNPFFSRDFMIALIVGCSVKIAISVVKYRSSYV
ncbi:O-antigen polymerase [Deinococcus sp. Leaf326]|uniref:O-antigen polymerase n=1 Tax=Deinococcus sp. Leaf326 TaxID=1736338 RepID=UPI000B25DCCB|nr:O-antigen polymerase [Deinococcus sp. Leaf326]